MEKERIRVLVKKLASPHHGQKPGGANGSPTCPVPDGQVVSLLKDNVQLVHCWPRRLELCITGPDNIDALQKEEVTQINKNVHANGRIPGFQHIYEDKEICRCLMCYCSR